MRLELPEHKKLIYEMTIAIRWGDMDAMGHLNNTSYFRYMETCRIDCMERVDAPGLVYAAGGATTIWVDFPKQKAMALPDWVRTLVA